jgi:hypothetical protein
MDWWGEVRLEVLRGEGKKGEILRRERIHREMLMKHLNYFHPLVIA